MTVMTAFDEPSRIDGRRDAFPSTKATLLGDLLGRGDPVSLAEARRHILGVYAEPLKVYFRGSTFRGIGEADELVHGFLVDALGRDHYLSDWMQSQRPLRFWLMTGFRFYLLKAVNKQKRDRIGPLVEDHASVDATTKEFNREVAIALVRAAAQNAERTLQAADRSAHWVAFVSHHLRGQTYDEVARSLGVERTRAIVMARTGMLALRRALREVVGWENATDAAVDAEVRDLLESLRP